MSCTNCGSLRVAHVGGKCSDMAQVTIGEKKHFGYMPSDLGVGGGDYITFRFCLECGIIQGQFPIEETALEAGRDEG